MDARSSPESSLCIAFDVDSLAEAMALADTLSGYAAYAKVGMELFTSAGPEVITELRNRGFGIFLDLKFHDIPNTVHGAIKAAVNHGASLVNVHAMGGSAMLSAAVDAGIDQSGNKHVSVLAVTILTSIDQSTLNTELGINGEISEAVLRLATMSRKAGAAGVVASPREISSIRQICPPPFLIVTPSIRPAGEETQDQKRVATPRAAAASGADLMVVGRPITGSTNPQTAAKRVLEEIASANR